MSVADGSFGWRWLSTESAGDVLQVYRSTLYTVSQKKLCKLIFCQNFAKFLPIVTIYGTKIAERTSFSAVYTFSTSPNLCQRTTVLLMSQIVRDTGLTAADAWALADDRSTWRALRPTTGYAQQ